MYLKNIINNVLLELEDALSKISDKSYTQKSQHLFNATIGQHVRHIIELFQCLQNGYEIGIVNYENRKRDLQIEVDKDLAIALMKEIVVRLDMQDKPLVLEAQFGNNDQVVKINSNYLREVAYNLEHTIHHMALIRVGINELTDVSLSPNFGVAPATIQYRKECAQ
jgi:uncharacterized damage-inducible protein DinB